MAPAAPVTTSFPGSLLERPNIVDRYYSTVRWWYSILGWVSFLLRMLMPSSPPTRFREAHILTTSTIPSTNHQPSSKLGAWDWEYESGTANLRSTARDQSVRSICGQKIIPYLEWPAARFQIWDPTKPMSTSRTDHTFVFKWAVFILFLASRLNFLWAVFSGLFSFSFLHPDFLLRS